jgi:hypothetical protein
MPAQTILPKMTVPILRTFSFGIEEGEFDDFEQLKNQEHIGLAA